MLIWHELADPRLAAYVSTPMRGIAAVPREPTVFWFRVPERLLRLKVAALLDLDHQGRCCGGQGQRSGQGYEVLHADEGWTMSSLCVELCLAGREEWV